MCNTLHEDGESDTRKLEYLKGVERVTWTMRAWQHHDENVDFARGLEVGEPRGSRRVEA